MGLNILVNAIKFNNILTLCILLFLFSDMYLIELCANNEIQSITTQSHGEEKQLQHNIEVDNNC